MPSADKIYTPPKGTIQDTSSKPKVDRRTVTDAQELYALLGQVADLADHARRGLDLAGYSVAADTVSEMIAHAREIAKLKKKIEGVS